jgi:hypothetical protein
MNDLHAAVPMMPTEQVHHHRLHRQNLARAL